MSGQNNNQISEYGELAQFVAEKFDEVKKEIKEVKDEVKEVKDEVKEVKDEVKEVRSDISAVLTRVTMLGDKIDDQRAEQIELKRLVDRHA